MRRNKVKYIDYVEVAVEKEKYAKQNTQRTERNGL